MYLERGFSSANHGLPLDEPIRAAQRYRRIRFALLHGGHEVQHAATRVAGEASKYVPGQTGAERVVALASMNPAATLKLIAMAAQTWYLMMAQYRLQAHCCFTAEKSARRIIGFLPPLQRQP